MQEIYSTEEFESAFTYTGTDLGLTWSPEAVFFRLWAPIAKAVYVQLYETGTPDDTCVIRKVPMQPDIHGTWTCTIEGNWDGKYYTYLVMHPDRCAEVCDPYAFTTGVNGHRAMILDMKSTDPAHWDQDVCPISGLPMTDAVIYELHVRDHSAQASSGIRNKRKYLGVAETGTKLRDGISTGLDHIRSLGITHIQLMPVFDFGSIDEADADSTSYNWGYDPAHFHVPEGSYSSDPFHGEVRVRELKQMIQSLHRHGFGVVMDVVFNHVYRADSFCINQITPGYFTRPGANGSGCGNDTATERSMVRKYILDTLLYWVEEYHIDGFRFDLAGLIDTQTITSAMELIHRKHPAVFFYGEGWHMDTKPTKQNLTMANQGNSALLKGFAFFNDTTRDLLRGSVFSEKSPGFAAGAVQNKDALHSSFMGLTPWACSPEQSIQYVSCHDNHTLFDKLRLALPKASEEEIIRRCRLAAAFTLLSQGIPFLLAGEEMLRSKPLGRHRYESNSYRSCDRINAIKWTHLRKEAVQDQVRYYQGLIAFRKAHPSLRLSTREEVFSHMRPLPCSSANLVAFRLKDPRERIVLLFNSGSHAIPFHLPDGQWMLCIDADRAGTEPLQSLAGEITVPPAGVMVLIQPTPTEIKDVVAALLWRGDKFLICQRPAHKARGMLWEFVGGKREENETKQQALIRECREELDIQVEVGDVFTEVIHRYPDIHIRLTLYHCTLPEGEPKALEHNDLRWIHPSQIPEYDFCPADTDILRKIQEDYL